MPAGPAECLLRGIKAESKASMNHVSRHLKTPQVHPQRFLHSFDDAERHVVHNEHDEHVCMIDHYCALFANGVLQQDARPFNNSHSNSSSTSGPVSLPRSWNTETMYISGISST